ncbi:MAG: thiamine phosphate synthase [Pseudomonadota bacterium]
MPDDVPRLYLVTPREGDVAALLPGLEAALGLGLVACLRLDLATKDDDEWTRAVNLLMPVCHAADVPMVITDWVAMVEPLGLDGVHLAANHASVKKLRKSLGKDRIIGAAGGTTRHRAMTLAEAGADYVTLGPLSADGAPSEGRADDALFRWWAEMIETPAVAEGGVDLAAARRLAEAADFLVPDTDTVWSAPASTLPAFAEAIR